MNEIPFSQILKAKRKELDWSPDQMAKAMGIKTRMYQLYERGDHDKTTSVRKENYLRILSRLKKDTPIVSEAAEVYRPERGNVIFVPLYAYGGFLSGYANKVFMDTLERYSYPGITGEHYMFEVQGDSMNGFVSAGDRVIARPEEKLEWMVKNRAYVLQTTDGILIKFFDHIKGDTAYFRSANKEYKDLPIPLKSLKRIYQVVRVDKDPYKIDLEALLKKLSS